MANGDRLVLRNDLAELGRLSSWLHRWANEHAVASRISFAVALCLEQAVTDIIMSCDQDPVEISVELEHNTVTVVARVDDDGPHVDLGHGSSKVTSLEKTRMGDLGLRLMRSFANGIEYERCDDRNRLTLRFLRSEDAAVLTA
jgi:serine/threonine-protein kinase RsbW